RRFKEAEWIYDLRITIYAGYRSSHFSLTLYGPMIRQLTITPEPINEAALVPERRMSSGMGAAIYFLGVVREAEGEEKISAIDYEAFQKMAEHQFHLLFDEMEK